MNHHDPAKKRVGLEISHPTSLGCMPVYPNTAEYITKKWVSLSLQIMGCDSL